MKKIILNNKSNLSYEEVVNYKKELEKIKNDKCEIVYFPSIAYLALFNKSNMNIGSQDFYSHAYGQYTGEVNLECLKDMHIKYTMVGHSDRKRLKLDTYDLMKEKLFKSISSNFRTILCVGAMDIDTDNIRFIKKELKRLLKGVDPTDLKYLSIAYEPVWAIGNGNAESPKDVKIVVDMIKEYMLKNYNTTLDVYYGGSVNAQNVKSYLEFCDGVLVGRKSNDINETKKLIEAATE